MTIGRSLGGGACQHVIDRCGAVGPRRADRRDGRLELTTDQLRIVGRVREWQPAGEKFEDGDAEAESVGADIDGLAA